jgi:UDP-N-acetylglucosamine--N-acetylmuramyl-(pentapeptide) pyrophosphoryl-undecaprenol N-acetylglucosamine transferase
MNKTLVFTGGHHTSALVVARELKEKGWEIVWLGHRHSMWGDKSDSAEYKEVTAQGIKFCDLKAGKFYRTYNPLKLIRIPLGFIQSFILLSIIKPRGIVSFGGYLAVPVVIMGRIMGIAAITHEQTITAGWANKLIAGFAVKIALTWPESAKYYPEDKTEVVGLPIRNELLNSKNNIKKDTIYITGGKQGSHTLNQIVFDSLGQLLKKYKIIHQTGSSTLYNDYETGKLLANDDYQVFDFDSRKALDALQSCSIVVGRSGAHTVYELAILGKRSVLIPIPWVSHNEQYLNAKLLEDHGLAIILEEKNLSSASLVDSLGKADKLSGGRLTLPTDATLRMIKLIESEFK